MKSVRRAVRRALGVGFILLLNSGRVSGRLQGFRPVRSETRAQVDCLERSRRACDDHHVRSFEVDFFEQSMRSVWRSFLLASSRSSSGTDRHSSRWAWCSAHRSASRPSCTSAASYGTRSLAARPLSADPRPRDSAHRSRGVGDVRAAGCSRLYFFAFISSPLLFLPRFYFASAVISPPLLFLPRSHHAVMTRRG